jgi:hypothetical protein
MAKEEGMAKGHQLALGCVLGAILATGVLLVGGLVTLIAWGFHLYESEVCEHLGAHPAVDARLGPLESCEVLFSDSVEIEDPDTIVFSVRGRGGQGKAFVQSTSTGPNGAEEYQGVLLEVDGERILVEGRVPPTR